MHGHLVRVGFSAMFSSVQVKKKFFVTIVPTTEPIFDLDHPIYITHHSVSLQWKFDYDNCSKLNGFFTKFTVELKVKFLNYKTKKKLKIKIYIFFRIFMIVIHKLKKLKRNQFLLKISSPIHLMNLKYI